VGDQGENRGRVRYPKRRGGYECGGWPPFDKVLTTSKKPQGGGGVSDRAKTQ